MCFFFYRFNLLLTDHEVLAAVAPLARCAAILAARPMLRPRLAERFPDHADAILDALLDVPQPSLESALGN